MFHLLFRPIGVADDLGSLIEHWELLERDGAIGAFNEIDDGVCDGFDLSRARPCRGF